MLFAKHPLLNRDSCTFPCLRCSHRAPVTHNTPARHNSQKTELVISPLPCHRPLFTHFAPYHPALQPGRLHIPLPRLWSSSGASKIHTLPPVPSNPLFLPPLSPQVPDICTTSLFCYSRKRKMKLVWNYNYHSSPPESLRWKPGVLWVQFLLFRFPSQAQLSPSLFWIQFYHVPRLPSHAVRCFCFFSEALECLNA